MSFIKITRLSKGGFFLYNLIVVMIFCSECAARRTRKIHSGDTVSPHRSPACDIPEAPLSIPSPSAESQFKRSNATISANFATSLSDAAHLQIRSVSIFRQQLQRKRNHLFSTQSFPLAPYPAISGMRTTNSLPCPGAL